MRRATQVVLVYFLVYLFATLGRNEAVRSKKVFLSYTTQLVQPLPFCQDHWWKIMRLLWLQHQLACETRNRCGTMTSRWRYCVVWSWGRL